MTTTGCVRIQWADVRRMRRSRFRAWALGLAAIFCVLVLTPAADSAEAQALSTQEANASLLPGPSTNGQPIRVRVGLYILNLVSLSEVDQTFSFTGYMTETWNDPRLAFTPKAGEESTRYYRKSDIWFPLLQFDNSTVPRMLSGYMLTGEGDGTVRYIEKFSVHLSSNMYLRAFPFDSQDLEVYVHPFGHHVRPILLTADQESTGVSSAPYTPLPLWDTGSIKYRSRAGHIGNGPGAVSYVVFRIHVVRHSEYYIFRIFVPLFLMVAISWGVLWIPPADLASQLTISVTTVLTLVAFSVAVSNVLPPVPYLTYYDSFFLVSFLFILLTTAEAILIHTANGRDRDAALTLRRFTRRLIPSLYLIAVVVMAFIFLR
jgi:Neurotransmitter-gated ion-channel ligand binding domain